MNIPHRVLMGPGPSDVPHEVLAALAQPTIGHLDPVFLTMMDQVQDLLARLFGRAGGLTMPMSGTGSAGMETLFANLVEPGDRALICVAGVFGERMVDVATRCGAVVERIDVPWGRAFEPGEVIAAIERVEPDVVGIVHAETSTGVHQPLDGIGAAAQSRGGLLLVDCVTSLGGMPVETDAWDIDAAYSGTQKCLSCPPGLAPISLSDRAVQRIERRTRKVQSWYLDLSMLRAYWGDDRAYHHTAPVNMIYGLHRGLELVFEEGLDARFARHRSVHKELGERLEGLGIRFLSQEGRRLPMLNAVSIPDGADDARVRRALLDEYGIEIGGGLGALKGKAWRIGLMGHAASRRNVLLLTAALSELLR